jgi:hypothetical protein
VFVPHGQKPTPIRDAHEIARALGGELADFASVCMEIGMLQRLIVGEHLLAVSSRNLPGEGWYRLDRNTGRNTMTFTPMTEARAEALTREGCVYEVLHVNRRVADAAGTTHSVALGFVYGKGGRYLHVYDWPLTRAVVVLAEQADGNADAKEAARE